MAEFCLEGFNELNETSYTEKDVVLSKDKSFCEHCSEIKQIVLKVKNGQNNRNI